MSDQQKNQKSKIILSDGNEIEGNKIMAVYKDNDSFPDTGLVSNENWNLDEIFEIKMMLDHFLLEMIEDRFSEPQQQMHDKIQFLLQSKKQEILDKLTEEETELFEQLYSNYDWELVQEGELDEIQNEELINELLAKEEVKSTPETKDDDKVIRVDFREK